MIMNATMRQFASVEFGGSGGWANAKSPAADRSGTGNDYLAAGASGCSVIACSLTSSEAHDLLAADHLPPTMEADTLIVRR